MQLIGYLTGEKCNRNGCSGILHVKEWWHGPCTCYKGRSALCYSCINLKKAGCCPECEWNKISSLTNRFVIFEKVDMAYKILFTKHIM